MISTDPDKTLPAVLVGPILRRASPKQICLQLISSRIVEYRLELYGPDGLITELEQKQVESLNYPLGSHCWLNTLIINFDRPLPTHQKLKYDLQIIEQGASALSIADWAPELRYPGEPLPSFQLTERLQRLAHGSCRKPHHRGGDGLVRLDQQCEASLERRPDLLIMSGDQLYADDVAGPMLFACHQLANRLGLPDEEIEGAAVSCASELERDPRCYYQRSELLPDSEATEDLLFQQEQEIINEFAAGMTAVARVLANTPTYMIFDDHDVTDDWNLSAAWEMAAYGHPFSARIIGNAMIGYLLFQGLGNEPERLKEHFHEPLLQLLNGPTTTQHQQFTELMQSYPYWGYEIPIEPGIVVLDTRTQRWRSERSPQKPSGLMDWEQLVDLQQCLINRKQVILVSAAPIFGVKLIEAIQRVFTLIGKPLMVDAENWMAHPGSANVILNIFRHSRTPEQFVVLSGDVHYSFVYDIKLRFRNGGPRIYQITSSGLRNAFPGKLLAILDRLNRWLYASWSPLNWLTKRRLMPIRPRIPSQFPIGRRLVNSPGIGWIEFDKDGVPQKIQQLGASGKDHQFSASREDEHWS